MSGLALGVFGQNYRVCVYEADAPLAEIARFYEAHLPEHEVVTRDAAQVELRSERSFVRLSTHGRGTRIRVACGPQ